ncbi:MAG: hypothetical protein ACXWEY_03500 [Bacteroidia bacterium]
MELTSVTQIKAIRTQLKELLAKIDINNFKDQKFGSEQEYTYKGLVYGVSSLLADVNALIKAPTQLVKFTTYSERSLIVAHLTNIHGYIQHNPQAAVEQIEGLKKLLVPHYIRFTKDRLLEFDSEIEEVQRKKIALEEEITEFLAMKDAIIEIKSQVEENKKQSDLKLEEFDEQFGEIENRNTELSKSTETLKSKIAELSTLNDDAREISKSVNEIYNESKANEKVISGFSQKVQNREQRLDEIDKRTHEYKNSLTEFQNERQNLLTQAQELINSAKTALNYKTAEGLSASFQSQYEAAKDSYHWAWLVFSGLCLIGAAWLGVWAPSRKVCKSKKLF